MLVGGAPGQHGSAPVHGDRLVHGDVDHDATLVKIADNAHNSLPERVKALAEKWPDKPPVTRYDDARPVLYAAVPVEETRKILARVNPWLLKELDDMLDDADDTDYENLSYDDPEGATAAGDPAAAPAEAAGETESARD